MPRPLRVHFREGALYYVTCRALPEQKLFKDEEDYRAYLALLKGYQQQFGFKLFAFVLLPDHLHLCLELTTDTTISTVMHAINSRYVKYVGKRYGLTGHLFQERFRLTLIEKAPSLLRITGYLHTHPRRSGVGGDSPAAYPWSSYPNYLAASASPATHGLCLDCEVDEVLGVLSREHPGRSYEQHVLGMSSAEWERMRKELDRPVMGSEAFAALVEQQRKTIRRPEAAGKIPKAAPRRRALPSLALTSSLAVAFLSVCAALLYGKNLSTLRETVQALAHERALQFGGASARTGPEEPTAKLAAFRPPIQLNDTRIEVAVRSLAGSSDHAAQQDVLEFREGKLHSRALGDQGFAPSKYTMSRREDGIVVWETAQADKTGTIVYWRGEWDGQAMRGIVTRHAPGKAQASYTFVGMARTPTGSVAPDRKEI